jgi:hypothetical protein
MSGARGLTVQQRGYTLHTGTNFNFEKYKNGYMQKLLLKEDDCAMACDNEPSCKSFQVFNDGSKGDRSTCAIYTKKSTEFTGGAPDSTQKNMKHYNKTSTTVVPEGLAKMFVLRNAVNQSPDGADNGILLDDGGVFYNGTNTKDITCDDPKDWCDYQSNPTGMYIARENVPAGTNHSSASMQLHTGVKACAIPGVVVNTVPTDRNGTDRPWQTQWLDNSYIYCGYNSIDNDWIAKYWETLDTYLKNTTDISYTVPKSNFVKDDGGQDQTGIFKVDSVKVARNQYCNTVPLSTFTSDLTATSRCRNTKMSAGGLDDWKKFILDRASREDWSKDRVPELITSSCQTDNDVISPYCKTAVNVLQTSDNFSQVLKTGLNTLTNYDKNGLSENVKTKIEEYCAKNESAEECGCRNAVVYGVNNCKPGITGCEDMIEFKKVKDAIPDTTNPLYQFLNAINVPRALSQACKIADENNSGLKLRYGKKPNDASIILAPCIQKIVNEGGEINAQNITLKCQTQINQYMDKTSSTNVNKSQDSGQEDTTTSSKAWIWILLALFVVCGSLLLGGGFFLISSKRSS